MKTSNLKKACIKIIASVVLTVQIFTITQINNLPSGENEVCGDAGEDIHSTVRF
ncbi:MAG: hypothetical protein HDQ99_05420 [Lachnospiraceae bacterium]|nr:hypothetical protein [Lachnospiraceae bacterium]